MEIPTDSSTRGQRTISEHRLLTPVHDFVVSFLLPDSKIPNQKERKVACYCWQVSKSLLCNNETINRSLRHIQVSELIHGSFRYEKLF